MGHFFKDSMCLTHEDFSPGLIISERNPGDGGNDSLLLASIWDIRVGVAVCSHLSGWGKLGGPAVLHRLADIS